MGLFNVTGGISPNVRGRLTAFGSQLSYPWQVAKHRKLTQAEHAEGSKIAMQILHAGRYAYHPCQSWRPSANQSANHAVQAISDERTTKSANHSHIMPRR